MNIKKIYLFFIAFVCVSFSFCLHAEKCVLVVGGAGYIGARVNEKLHQSGYQTVVLDNLSSSDKKAVRHGTFIQGDLGDCDLLEQIFEAYSIDAVMHFAAFLDVGESVKDPLKYYSNNVAATLNLLQAMEKHKVNVFVFSSTAAIFGTPQEDFISETHPCNPLSPYGKSKLMVESILQDLDKARGFKFCALRYFNAAGGDPEGICKNYSTKQSTLISTILRSVAKSDGRITVFGTDYATKDGTGIRDYVHIEDLARAHILAMERLFQGASSACYNLGNGSGFSVKEVIAGVEKVTGFPIQVTYGPRRLGDPAISISDATKARKELGWEPEYTSIEQMIEHAWKSMR